MNKSKVAIVVSQVISLAQLVGGVFIMVVFGINIGMDIDDHFSDGMGNFVIYVVFFAIGLWLVLRWRKTRKLIAEFKKYVSVISVERIDSINQLAATVGETPEMLKKNLETMIKRNYFVNAYINYENETLVIANANVLNYDLKQEINEGEYNLCNCVKCGAISKIRHGEMAKCDYCGSSIK